MIFLCVFLFVFFKVYLIFLDILSKFLEKKRGIFLFRFFRLVIIFIGKGESVGIGVYYIVFIIAGFGIVKLEFRVF